MIAVRLARPWLVADLGGPHRVLSWTLNRPGLVTADRIAWREVRDAELPADLDAGAWFAAELAAAGLGDAPAFLTSRDIGRHHLACAGEGDLRAACLATVGLGNAVRVGERAPDAAPAPAGTINLAIRVDRPLGEGALIEALSVAAAARTRAMIEAGPRLASGPATGTGTDCIAVAAPLDGGPAEPHAGLHTAAGAAVGRAVLGALVAGIGEWMEQKRAGALD